MLPLDLGLHRKYTDNTSIITCRLRYRLRFISRTGTNTVLVPVSLLYLEIDFEHILI